MIDVSETRDAHYVRPWRRFFAKTIDYSFLMMGLGFISGIVLAAVNPAWLPVSLVQTLIFSAVVFVASLVIEGMLIALFGTTLGKALFRTGVVNEAGEKLGITKAVARSLYCGVAGLGAGIPFVSLIAYIMGYMKLESDGVTIWDKHIGAYVVHEKMTRLNWVLGISFFVLTYAGNIALNIVSTLQ